jgi:flagellar motor switch protein FliN
MDLNKESGLAAVAQSVLGHNEEPTVSTTTGKLQLDRVIAVPLPVTIRFGQRKITLRELLALTTGSLVELDRQVEEPVDLMLGERVIARGEVVVVDGNYGMRVLEVVEQPVPQRTV